MNKQRLDQLVYSRGLAPSREKAKAFIMEGLVFVDGERAHKAGEMVSPEAVITVKGGLRYVSRGGLKLEKAMQKTNLQICGAVCMDIGASTGGFTDCMLQNGAKKVYAVDVGYGQLAWKLRQDPRVINLERTNARYLTNEQIPEAIEFASVDVSFISLTKILPVVASLLDKTGTVVVLVKPQFEAGKDQVGKKGVVRDAAVHRTVLQKIYRTCQELSFSVLAMDFSPIKGPEGNIEYLFTLCRGTKTGMPEEAICSLVDESHLVLL